MTSKRQLSSTEIFADEMHHTTSNIFYGIDCLYVKNMIASKCTLSNHEEGDIYFPGALDTDFTFNGEAQYDSVNDYLTIVRM